VNFFGQVFICINKNVNISLCHVLKTELILIPAQINQLTTKLIMFCNEIKFRMRFMSQLNALGTHLMNMPRMCLAVGINKY